MSRWPGYDGEEGVEGGDGFVTGGVEQLDCGSCRQLRRGAGGGHGLEREVESRAP